MRIASVLFAFVLIIPFALAHEEGAAAQMAAPQHLFGIDPLTPLYLSAVIVITLSIVALAFGSHLNKTEKKIFFIVIAVPVAISTAMIIADTVYLNITSESGGPVHWHADIRMTVCGQIQHLPNPENMMENRMGTNLLHHHNEGAEPARNGFYRIHVEGVIKDMHDVEIGEFFKAIGGLLTNDTIGIPTEQGGIRVYSNGDLCPEGRPGTLKMIVDGKPNDQFGEFLIAPYSAVPPGNTIELVFD